MDTELKGLRIMTVAPELPGALELIEYLRERDVVVSIGHTDASADITEEAIKRGAALMTHAYNSFGYPGPLYPEKRKNKVCGRRLEKAIDVLLEDETVYAELISDKTCVHVAPVLQRTLLKMKGTDHSHYRCGRRYAGRRVSFYKQYQLYYRLRSGRSSG